jgi:glycosyltransferase involved in cell wall biosynthesis
MKKIASKSISLCMIVKNEEKYLAQAISSVKDLVDEIIIVDTGSTDRTKEIAKKFTSKLFDLPWRNDFAEARNFSLRQAKKDWILVLDADEVIAKKDHETIQKLVRDQQYDAYACIQASYTNDITQFGFTPIKESAAEAKKFLGYIYCNIIRLFRNNRGIEFANPVHESVDASIKDKARIKKTDLIIHHYQFEKGAEKQKEKQLQYLVIYEEKKEKFSNKAKLYRDMGIIYANFKQEYEKAISCFKKSLESNQDNIKTYAGLLLCYALTKQKHEAEKIIEVCQKRFPASKEIPQFKQIVSGM